MKFQSFERSRKDNVTYANSRIIHIEWKNKLQTKRSSAYFYMGISITLVSSLLVIVFLFRKMEDLSKLKEMGESLGYEGDKLRDFVREQQAQ